MQNWYLERKITSFFAGLAFLSVLTTNLNAIVPTKSTALAAKTPQSLVSKAPQKKARKISISIPPAKEQPSVALLVAKGLDKAEPYLKLLTLFSAKALEHYNPLKKIPGIDYLKVPFMPFLGKGEKDGLCEEIRCATLKFLVSEAIYQYKELVGYIPEYNEEVSNPNSRGWEADFKKFVNDFVEIAVEQSGSLAKVWMTDRDKLSDKLNEAIGKSSEKLLVTKMLPSILKGLTKSEDFKDWADIDGKDGKQKVNHMLALALFLTKAKSGKSSYCHTTDIVNKLAIDEFKERKLADWFDSFDEPHRKEFAETVLSTYLGFYAEFFWGKTYTDSLLWKIPAKTLTLTGKAAGFSWRMGKALASKIPGLS